MVNESEEALMSVAETEEESKIVEVQQSSRMLSSTSSILLACSLLCALIVGVAAGRRSLPAVLGGQGLLAKYNANANVLSWRKLAGELKGTASAYGVDLENNTARDPGLRKMMADYDMTKTMDERVYSRIDEILSKTLELAKRDAEADGLKLPASRMGRLDAANAMKRLEQRQQKKEERRLQALSPAAIVPGATPVGEIGGKATDQISIAQCVLQSNAALINIANIGLDLNAILQVCRKTPKDQNGNNQPNYDPIDCGSNIADLIGQFAGLASTLATVPSFCNISEDLHAVCASDISSFVQTVSTVIADGFAISLDCPGDKDPRPVWGINGGANQPREGFPHRRLREAPEREVNQLPAMSWENQAENDQGIAQCFWGAYGAANDIPSMAIDIWTTQLDCQDADTEDDKAVCAADIISIIMDVTTLLADASNLAANCPQDLPPRAACIADSADIAVNAMNFGAWGAVIKQDCRDINTPGPDHFRVPLRR